MLVNLIHHFLFLAAKCVDSSLQKIYRRQLAFFWTPVQLDLCHAGLVELLSKAGGVGVNPASCDRAEFETDAGTKTYACVVTEENIWDFRNRICAEGTRVQEDLVCNLTVCT